MVDAHQGRIKVKSKEGQGSTFSVYLKKGNAHFQEEQLMEGEYTNPVTFEQPVAERAIDMDYESEPFQLMKRNDKPVVALVEDNLKSVNILKTNFLIILKL